MSNLVKNFYFWIIAVVFIGGYVISAVKIENSYPFYSGTMYSDFNSGEHYHLVKSFCTTWEGKEIPVTELDLWYQEQTYYEKMYEVATQVPLNEEQTLICKRELKRFVLDVEQECQRLSVYHYYWKRFTGPLKDNPTTKEFLCDLGVEDARKL